MKNKKKKILLVLTPVLVVALLFASYTVYSLAHTSHALHTLEEYQAAYPNLTITLDSEGMLTLLPPDADAKDAGIVFYQGASVEPLAYVPLLSQLAEAGYPIYAPQFPCGMAVFDLDAAEDIMAQHSEIDSWYIAGHSMGGRCASKYAASDNSNLLGVISISSPVDESLAACAQPLLMIYGELDGIYHGVTPNDVFPEDTSVYCIPGANHAQFGDYGHQFMDKKATITAEEQRAIGASYILDWLER